MLQLIVGELGYELFKRLSGSALLFEMYNLWISPIHPLSWHTYIYRKKEKPETSNYWLQLITFLHDPANRIRLTNWREEQKP